MDIFLTTSCDFSVSGVNHALELAEANQLGKVLRVDYLPKAMFDEWSLICENGKIISKGSDV